MISNASKSINIGIIGGGLGGISAAIYLKKAGFNVTIIEKNSTLGGRANLIEENGFRFDVGPSLLNYPWVFEDLFKAAGENLKDHVELIEVKSGVRFLWEDKEEFHVSSDYSSLNKEISRLEKSENNGLNKFIKSNSNRYEIAFKKLLNSNLDNPLLWGKKLGLKEIFSGSMTQSMYKDLSKHFKSKYIKEAFGSYAMYLGGSPFNIPAFFSILPYGEISYGLWMPKGGIYSLVEKLEYILVKNGIKIQKEITVSEIEIVNKKVAGVITSKGERINFDVIVSNVDLPTTNSVLIKPSGQKKSILPEPPMTPSVLTFYWGLKKTTDLPHHTIFLPNDYKKSFKDLFETKKFPEGMPFYTSSPCTTDPGLAPNGKSTMFVLVPLPVTSKDSDVNSFAKDTPYIKNKIFQKFNHHGIDLKKEDIIYEKLLSPNDWKEMFGLYKTSAFGVSHNLFNIGPFRGKNKSKLYKGLYFTGASTNPGTGLPMVTISGKLTAERVIKDVL